MEFGMQPATEANSASYLCRTENEYRPKCSDVLRLGSKGRHDSLWWSHV